MSFCVAENAELNLSIWPTCRMSLDLAANLISACASFMSAVKGFSTSA
jgi:hypothetical protein